MKKKLKKIGGVALLIGAVIDICLGIHDHTVSTIISGSLFGLLGVIYLIGWSKD